MYIRKYMYVHICIPLRVVERNLQTLGYSVNAHTTQKP